jgi:hypothetical protein
MSDRRRAGRVSPARLARLAVVAGLTGLAGLAGLIGVAGCSNGSGGSASHNGGAGRAGATDAAGVKGGVRGEITADRLGNALLTRINGAAPSAAPDTGDYASLRLIKTAAAQAPGTAITPTECDQATVVRAADLDTGALGDAPAAVENFRVGADGVSEVLARYAGSAAVAPLTEAVPAGCTHYSATTEGKTFQYTVKQVWVPGMGVQPARILNISSARRKSNVWSALFRGDGFLGSVTVAGPNASETSLRELGQQAYAYATLVLLQG